MGGRRRGADSIASDHEPHGRRRASESTEAPSAAAASTDLLDASPLDVAAKHRVRQDGYRKGSGPAPAIDSIEDVTTRANSGTVAVDRKPLDVSTPGRQGDSASAASNGDNDTADPGDAIRRAVGTGTVQLSEYVNSNLVVARYAAYAGIGLLAAYGVSHSPLFFRYRTVADIPSQHFLRRRRIKCRLVTDTSGQSASSWETAAGSTVRHGPGPIRFKVRHLSWFERYCLVPSSWFDSWMRLHPSRFRPDQNRHELLTVELAGVLNAEAPQSNVRPVPSMRQDHGSDIVDPCDAFMRRFVREANQPIVTVQLLARRTYEPGDEKSSAASSPARQHILDGGSTMQSGTLKKRRIPDHMVSPRPESASSVPSNDPGDWAVSAVGRSDGDPQVAVAKVAYRSNFPQLFSTDLAHQLVRSGLAVAASDDGLFPQSIPPQTSTTLSPATMATTTAATVSKGPVPLQSKILDADRSLSTLQKDANYLSLLDEAEHEAARDMAGAWSDPAFRDNRRDVVEEVEFQVRAPWWKKAWRFLLRRS